MFTMSNPAIFTGRLQMWAFAWRLAKDRPILGGGFDVFYHPDAYQKYGPDLEKKLAQ